MVSKAVVSESKRKNSGWERKLTTYVVAGSAVLVAAREARADTIVYSGPQNLTVGDDSTLNLDLNGDGIPDFQLSNHVNPATCEYCKDERVLQLVTNGSNGVILSSSGDGDAAALGGGVTIDGSQSFSTGDPNMAGAKKFVSGLDQYGDWSGQQNKYLGVRFEVPVVGTTSAEDQFLYGWIEMSVDPLIPPYDFGPLSGGTTVIDWAYNATPGDGITTPGVAEVPEPSSLALLALGAAGLTAYRRRQSKASASNTAL